MNKLTISDAAKAFYETFKKISGIKQTKLVENIVEPDRQSLTKDTIEYKVACFQNAPKDNAQAKQIIDLYEQFIHEKEIGKVTIFNEEMIKACCGAISRVDGKIRLHSNVLWPAKTSDAKKVPITPQPLLRQPPILSDNVNDFANEAFEIVGRTTEKEILEQLIEFPSTNDFIWAQLAGVGGQGKSRLALYLVNQAHDNEQWAAGFLYEDEAQDFQDHWKIWQPQKPTLIVFDYVIGKEPQIGHILRTLAKRKERDELANPVRILLVERERFDKPVTLPHEGNAENKASLIGRADWFDKLCKAIDKDEIYVQDSHFEQGVIELKQLDAEDLVGLVKQVAAYHDNPMHYLDEQISEILGRIDKEGRPLYAYFLGQTINSQSTQWTREDLLQRVLERDFDKRWKNAMGHKNVPHYRDEPLAMQLCALATLTGGVDTDQLERHTDFPRLTKATRRHASIFTGAFVNESARHHYIPPMLPDILGEWFILDSIDEGAEIQALMSAAWLLSPNTTAATLLRLSEDFTQHRLVSQLLDSISTPNQEADSAWKKVATAVFRAFLIESVNPTKVMFETIENLANDNNANANNLLGYWYATNEKYIDVRKAEAAFNQAISLNPDDATAFYNLGILLAKQAGRESEAEVAFNQAISLNPDDAATRYNLGILLAEQAGREGEAEVAYNQAISLNPEHASALNNLGILLAEQAGRESEAEAAYNQAIALNPDDAATRYNLGNLLVKQAGGEGDAEAAYNQAIALNPDDAATRYNLGVLLAAQAGRESEAEVAFNQAIVLNPDDAATRYNLGILLAAQAGRESEAEVAFNQAIALNPEHARALNNLGYLLAKQAGREGDAEAAYNQAIALNPEYAIALNNLGYLLAKQAGREGDAEAAYNQAIALNPEDAAALNNLGYLLAKQAGREGEAEAAYNQAIALNPEHARAQSNLGNLLVKQAGREGDAEAAYNQAIALNPEHARALNNLGNLLVKQAGREGDAEAAYNQAIALNPDDAATRYNLGVLLAAQAGRESEAEVAFNQAIALNPDDAAIRYNLGNLLAKQAGREGDAEAAYNQAIALNPEDAAALNNLGYLLSNQAGREGEAEAAYNQAIALNPEHAATRYNLGNLLADQAGRESEAEAAYNQAIALNPEDAAALNNLGYLLSNQAGREGEAENAYNQAITLNPEHARALSNLGYLLIKQAGREGDAEAAYNQAIALNPNNATAFYNLGHLLAKQGGREGEAEAAYNQAIALNPEHARALNNLGNLLAEQGGREYDAEVAYNRAISLNPDEANAYFGLGLLLKKQPGRLEHAKSIFLKLLEVEPGYAGAHFHLADILESIGDFKTAASHYLVLGKLLMLDSQLELAEVAYLRAIKFVPDSWLAYVEIGKLYIRMCDREKDAIASLNKAIELNPEDIESQELLVQLRRNFGDFS